MSLHVLTTQNGREVDILDKLPTKETAGGTAIDYREVHAVAQAHRGKWIRLPRDYETSGRASAAVAAIKNGTIVAFRDTDVHVHAVTVDGKRGVWVCLPA